MFIICDRIYLLLFKYKQQCLYKKFNHIETKINNKTRGVRMSKKGKNKTNYSWIIKITLLSLIISFIFSLGSEITLPNLNVISGIILIIIFIVIGIIFDMVGVAVTSSNITPFHSMNARKVKGASLAINLINNANKVSSFCNDVIGDICGIISGSAGVIIATNISFTFNFNSLLVSLITTSLIAALTIGGKALGKTFAVKNSNDIVFKFSKILSVFYRRRG